MLQGAVLYPEPSAQPVVGTRNELSTPSSSSQELRKRTIKQLISLVKVPDPCSGLAPYGRPWPPHVLAFRPSKRKAISSRLDMCVPQTVCFIAVVSAVLALNVVHILDMFPPHLLSFRCYGTWRYA